MDESEEDVIEKLKIKVEKLTEVVFKLINEKEELRKQLDQLRNIIYYD